MSTPTPERNLCWIFVTLASQNFLPLFTGSTRNILLDSIFHSGMECVTQAWLRCRFLPLSHSWWLRVRLPRMVQLGPGLGHSFWRNILPFYVVLKLRGFPGFLGKLRIKSTQQKRNQTWRAALKSAVLKTLNNFMKPYVKVEIHLGFWIPVTNKLHFCFTQASLS